MFARPFPSIRVLRFAIPSALVAVLMTAPLHAQVLWGRIQQFSFANQGSVSDIWFQNPKIGLIGFHWNGTPNGYPPNPGGNGTSGIVQRTTDGGLTWTPSRLIGALSNLSTPVVSDIWFLTPDTGWMTLRGNFNVGDDILWHTVDSGKTWMGINFGFNGASNGLASVWETDSTLVVTQNYGGAVWFDTTRTGGSWKQPPQTFTGGGGINGLAFHYLNGVATEFGKTGSNTFLTTTDGGRTWVNSTGGFQHEAWGIYYVPQSSGTFVVAPEDVTIAGKSQPSKVYRTTTYGHFWTQLVTLPIRTTGDIEGVGDLLYIQNSGGINIAPPGLMESSDGGSTWTDIGGPVQGKPDPYGDLGTDTRFAVTGCGNVIYAADDSGGLYKTLDAPGLVFVDSTLPRPDSAFICDTTHEFYYLRNFNTNTLVIEDISILDTNRRPARTHAVWLDSIPDRYSIILKGDSVAFRIAWHPGAMMDSTATDSVTIRVIYYASYFAPCVSSPQLAYDTVLLHVKLHGISFPANFAASPLVIKTDTLPLCTAVDTAITIINAGCDTMSITKATLIKGTWNLSDTSGKALALPIRVPAGDTLRLHLHALPTTLAALYDSLHVTMHYEGHDTAFGVPMRTYAKPDPSHPALTAVPALSFDSLATCDSAEDLLTLANTGCDTITLHQIDLANTHFEYLDTNGKALNLPLSIPADSTRRILVRFIPQSLGTQSTSLRLHYHYFSFDSSNVVTLSGTGAPSGTLSYPTSLNFGNVSICGPKDTTIVFRNTSCDSADLFTLIVPAPFILLDSAKLPEWIEAGKTESLRVRYIPSGKLPESKSVHFEYLINSGKTDTTTDLQFSGTGISGTSNFTTSPTLTANTFAFGTLSECDKAKSVTFAIYNTGCDTLRVTALTLDASLSTFAVTSDGGLPALLGPGDTLHITLAITALISNTYNGNFHIQYALADGTTHESISPVSLAVTQASGASSLSMTSPTSFDLKTVRVCTEPVPDTVVTIANTGCGTDTVFLTLTGTGFTLTPGPDTVLITPGETARIPIYYDDTSRGNLSATLAMQTNVQNNNLANVNVTAFAPPPDTVHFIVTVSQTPFAEGQTFTVQLKPDIVFSGTGLNDVRGIFEYRDDNFDVSSGSLIAAPGMQIVQSGPNRVGTTAHYSFDLKNPNGIPLDPTKAVVTLPMRAVVSDSVAGRIWVDSIALNGGDRTFGDCVLASSALGTNTTFSIECGDSTLMRKLGSRPIIAGERLRPNPVTQESGYQSTLGLTAAESGIAEIALLNALGETVSTERVALSENATLPYAFKLGQLPAGSYYYQVRFVGLDGSGTLSGTLVLIK